MNDRAVIPGPVEPAAILEVVRRYWGFDRLRPLQEEAIAAALAGRDSLVVLPTGGGKSLCYQRSFPAAGVHAFTATATERLKMACDMFDAARRLARAGLGDPAGTNRSPEFSVRLFLRLYRRDFDPETVARIAARLGSPGKRASAA